MIFRKMFTRFLLVIIISFTVLSAFLFSLLGNYVVKEKAISMLKAAGRISTTITDLISKDFDKYSDIFSISIEMISQNINSEIYLADSEGRITSRTSEKFKHHPIIKIEKNDLAKINRQEEISKISKIDGTSKPVLIIGVPVIYKDLVVGGIYLITDIPEIEKLRMDVLKMYFLSMIFSLFLSFVLIFVYSKKITDPIHAISKASKKLSGGDFSARVKVYKDDEIGELATSFNKMADSISKSEEMRRSFISDVSHELRTPMTTITGFVQGMIDDTIPDDKKKLYLGIVLDESKRLSKLVTDLLDVSRLTSDEVPLETSKFDINELIRVTVIGFDNRLNEKHLTVNVVFENEKEEVVADKDSIKRVVTNLLDNAVKFCNNKGEIEVATYKKGDKIVVSVKNEGEGISEEDQTTIFERFYKLDKSRSRNKNGVGLGLYIVKSIIEKHKEKIWIESVVGEYAKFLFTLSVK